MSSTALQDRNERGSTPGHGPSSRSDVSGSSHQPRSCASILELTFSSLAIVCFLGFIVVMIIRIDADMRGGGDKPKLEWWHVFASLGGSAAFFILWVITYYFSRKPTAPVVTGTGGQVLYDLLSSLLVSDLNTKQIENVNEATMLASVLQFVLYAVIMTYCGMAWIWGCSGCEVPYAMISGGLLILYFLRTIMLLVNGSKSYEYYSTMAAEVRYYQESMDQNRLFDSAVRSLHLMSNRTVAMLVDSLLWLAVVALAVLGSVWSFSDTCQTRCPTTFHINQFVLLSVYVTEGGVLLSYFAMSFYERLNGIELFKLLIQRVELHHEKQHQMMNAHSTF
jgi:hypothetical protein